MVEIGDRIDFIQQKKAHHYVVKLMGCRFVITAIHENPQIAWDGIRAGVAEIERIEDLAWTAIDDVWWKPYDNTKRVREQMEGYLTWEVGLVEQVERDGLVQFRRFD